MQKIDRLGWAAGLAFSAYGLRIGLRTTTPTALERLRAALPDGWQALDAPVVEQLYSLVAGTPAAPGARMQQYSVLYRGAERVARTLDHDAIFESFASDLQLFLAEFARDRVFVHAGVVAWQGQAIVLPGPTYTGKSTLVAALLRAGATYYSDEYAVFDAEGRVHPFPRPLSLRGGADEPPRKIASTDLGCAVGTEPLPVGLVALTQFKEGARWRPQRPSAGAAILGLLANTVAARRDPAAALAALQRVVAKAQVISGPRGEADQTATRLLRAAGNGRRRGVPHVAQPVGAA